MTLTLRSEAPPKKGEAYIAGGTTLVDLMKLGVAQPSGLVDLSRRDDLRGISMGQGMLTIGARTTMAEVAAHQDVRARLPMVVQSLELAASPQIREMATIGGNLLQRTRCSYFRDSRRPCNKRTPGSGCPAIGGDDAHLAILGTSDQCIASYPGDFAIAAIALGAELTIERDGSASRRSLAGLHRLPGDTPHLDADLAPGDLITAIHLPLGNWSGQTYHKVRDRASYAFATVSIAVTLRMEGPFVADARIGLGGVATIPWRSEIAETAIIGAVLDEASAVSAGAAAFADARPSETQAFKVDLGARAVARALLKAGLSMRQVGHR